MDIFYYWKQSLVMLVPSISNEFWPQLFTTFFRTVEKLITKCWWLLIMLGAMFLLERWDFEGIEKYKDLFFLPLFVIGMILLRCYIVLFSKENLEYSKQHFKIVFRAVILSLLVIFVVRLLMNIMVGVITGKQDWLSYFSFDSLTSFIFEERTDYERLTIIGWGWVLPIGWIMRILCIDILYPLLNYFLVDDYLIFHHKNLIKRLLDGARKSLLFLFYYLPLFAILILCSNMFYFTIDYTQPPTSTLQTFMTVILIIINFFPVRLVMMIFSTWGIFTLYNYAHKRRVPAELFNQK